MRQQGGKGKKNIKASLTIKNVQRNSIFGRYSEAEMIARLKGLAINPCEPQFARHYIQPLYNQILRVRKVIVLEESNIPWRKRKLEQFVKDKLLQAHSGFIVPDQQNVRKLKKLSSHTSIACLRNSLGSTKHGGPKILSYSRSSCSLLTVDDTLSRNPISADCSSIVDSNCHIKDISRILACDESMDDSNALCSEHSTPHMTVSLKIHNVNHSLRSTPSDGPNKKHLQPPRRSIRLMNFIGDDHLQRYGIPVGPQFQADVPMLSGAENKSVLIGKYKNDSNNSKWLGIRDWPIEIGNMKSVGGKIGKGRTNSCDCLSPRSIDCVRCHILEKRLILQCDLGPAFYSWKFDEMGEQVSSSWTLKEQKAFELVVKSRPSSNKKNFLKRALKRFPNKSRKDIFNYYFDVYIPKSMSVQTKSPTLKLVEIEGDDEEDCNSMDLRKIPKEKTLVISNCKDVKTPYLSRAS